MGFNVNSPILFVIVGVVVALVIAQSVFFLVKALKRAKEINMDMTVIRKTIRTAAVFTIMPAVAIVIGVMTLSKDLGLPLPWLRLSVVGSLSYETIAASNAESAMGLVFGQVTGLTAQQFVTILFVMTLSIMVAIWLGPILGKKLLGGMVNLGKKDTKWADLFQTSLFIGMIAAFLGYVFSDFTGVFKGETAGLVPVLVMLTSAVCMAIAGILSKKTKIRGIEDYALPASLLAGMAAAIPFTAWLG